MNHITTVELHGCETISGQLKTAPQSRERLEGLTKSTPEYLHPGVQMADSHRNPRTSVAATEFVCHSSPLAPEHYCPECGTYNADPSDR